MRSAAVSSLAKLGGPQAESALIRLVDENTFRTRPAFSVRTAIRNLGSMEVVRGMPVLRLVMEEGYREVVPVAARTLRQLADTITADDMLERVSHERPERRLRAVLTLHALFGRDTLPHC